MHTETIFSILDSVDSTNNYAMGKVHAGMAKHGMCWFSRAQTAGKGQRSKTWITEPGANIIMSIVVSPTHFMLSGTYVFNMAIAYACKNFLSGLISEEFKIKWPNDLFWRDRKAGGILIENVIRGNSWLWSVVGIGINVNQTKFESSIKDPVSLAMITKRSFDSVDLAKQLHQVILNTINDPGDIISAYNSSLFKKGEEVKLKKGGIIMNVIIDHVDSNGRLHVKGDHVISFEFGEVEWVF